LVSNAWRWMVARWPFDRRDLVGAAGFGALVYGIGLV
jgi:hypothetical protein